MYNPNKNSSSANSPGEDNSDKNNQDKDQQSQSSILLSSYKSTLQKLKYPKHIQKVPKLLYDDIDFFIEEEAKDRKNTSLSIKTKISMVALFIALIVFTTLGIINILSQTIAFSLATSCFSGIMFLSFHTTRKDSDLFLAILSLAIAMIIIICSI